MLLARVGKELRARVYEKKGVPSYFNPKEPLNLYGQIKSGIKPSEWRDCRQFWLSRLCKDPDEAQKEIRGWTKNHKQQKLPPLIDLTSKLKVHIAWFFKGYPRGKLKSLPHLEAEITGLLVHPEKKALEIKIAKTVEVKGLHNNQSKISKTTLNKK